MTERRAADARDRHLPVHRHRGLDALEQARRARPLRRLGAPPGDPARGVRGARRRRAGHRGRLVLRRVPRGAATRSRPPSPAQRALPPSRGRTARRSGSGWASTPAMPSSPAESLRRRSTSTGRRGSRRVAHGGQILRPSRPATCSTTTRSTGVTLRDLGEHRLKDLRRAGPHRPGHRRRPAGRRSRRSRSLDARPNNLPTQLTTFVGRDAELDEAGRPAGRRPGC